MFGIVETQEFLAADIMLTLVIDMFIIDRELLYLVSITIKCHVDKPDNFDGMF